MSKILPFDEAYTQLNILNISYINKDFLDTLKERLENAFSKQMADNALWPVSDIGKGLEFIIMGGLQKIIPDPEYPKLALYYADLLFAIKNRQMRDFSNPKERTYKYFSIAELAEGVHERLEFMKMHFHNADYKVTFFNAEDPARRLSHKETKEFERIYFNTEELRW